MKTKILSVFLVAFALALLVRLFALEGFIVNGDSMSPTILSGDYVFINKLAYLYKDPKRGDIVVAIPRGESFKVIKRIIVLPGERFSIEEDQVVIRTNRLDPGITLEEDYLIDDLELLIGVTQSKLDPEEYFILGDNRDVSIDSRELGFIDRWHIKGRAFGIFRLKSFKYIGL
ncbi:MAG: signal peptidase I [bacterium]|nr:signal peptidase I [bacterium]